MRFWCGQRGGCSDGKWHFAARPPPVCPWLKSFIYAPHAHHTRTNMVLVQKKNVTLPVWECFGFKPHTKGKPLDVTKAIWKLCRRVVPVKESLPQTHSISQCTLTNFFSGLVYVSHFLLNKLFSKIGVCIKAALDVNQSGKPRAFWPSLCCVDEISRLLPTLIHHFLTEQPHGNDIFTVLHFIIKRKSLKQTICCF